MKVLLVSANTLREPYPVYPLGLDYVAGAIAENHQVQIVDMNSLGGYDSLAAVIKEFSPDVIGLSLRNIDNTDTTDPRGFIGQYRTIVDVIRKHSDARLDFRRKRVYHISGRNHAGIGCRLWCHWRG